MTEGNALMRPSQRHVLYVGGTGTISWSCVQASVQRGDTVTVLNRGTGASPRPLRGSLQILHADIHDVATASRALGDRQFDAVVNFTSFTAQHAEECIKIFSGRTAQYVQISTAALYRKPPRLLPYRESTLRHSPQSSYATEKLHAEDVLLAAFAADGFPVTIVRPSHTYDDAKPPLPGDWTIVDRIARGAEIVVPGDGTSLWTVTHAEDFAVGLTGLLGNSGAIGEAFHITSDFVYSWNEIYEIVAAALGVRARLVHVPTDLLRLAAPDWRWTELIAGDLQYSVILDNSKISGYVPEFAPRITFDEGARRFAAWRSGHRDVTKADPAVDSVQDRLVSGYYDAEKVFSALAPS
jgi:nucleoside-diphosphate-sugar epimerase